MKIVANNKKIVCGIIVRTLVISNNRYYKSIINMASNLIVGAQP
jgi:hypothetical protein